MRVAAFALPALLAAALPAPGGAAAADLVRTNPGPPDSRAAAERARTDATVRRLDGAAARTLGACRRASGLQQRCSCYGDLRRLQAEVAREKQRVSNIMETLTVVAKESIRAANEDKKYWLGKLNQLNKMSEAVSGRLGELTGRSRRLGRLRNPRAATGGAAEEPVSEARCRAPERLRHRARPPEP